MDAVRRSLEDCGHALAAEADAFGIKAGSLDDEALQSSLAAAFPLHPLVAVTVGPLFRALAQNERSLFAFLIGPEPFGFQEFLRQPVGEEAGCNASRLDRLHDYSPAVVGPACFTHTSRG